MLKKIVLLIVLTLFLFNLSGATAPAKYFYTVLDFSKGLNTHINLWNLADNQASIARNVRFNEQYSSVSKRPVMISGGTIGTYAATSGHRYYKSDGAAKLLVTGSTFLRLRTAGALTYTSLKIGLSDGKRWSWVTFKDKAIGMNGSNNAIKYDGSTSITAATDGHRTAENLCADLGAPFAELNTGENLTASTWYQYKMMFYDGTTTTYSNARSNPILTGPSAVQDIYLTDIPIGPTGTTHRYIYRTLGAADKATVEGAGTAFYLVYTFTDDNSTVVYADDMDDATADDQTAWSTTSKTDATPPKCKYGIIHVNRLWMGGDTTATEQSYIYWSDEFNPDYFAIADYDQIRPDDGDTITFLREQNNILVIGKTNTIQNYYTTAASEVDWYPSNPFSFEGCPAPYSAANTPLGIFYLGRDGLYTYTGQGSQFVSDAVTPDIEDILETALDEVSGFYWKGEFQLAYTSRAVGGQINDRVLHYDTVRDAYALDHKNISCFWALSSGSDYGILYSGSSDTDGQIYAHEGTPFTLAKRYKSELDAGTLDDVVTSGTENDPEMEIGWDVLIDDAAGTIDGHSYGADAIIDRVDTAGTWESEVYRVNATSFDKLYWNESLGTTGNVIVEMKTCDDSACSGESYGSDYTDPSGTDISLESANDYVQFKMSLSTTDIDFSPFLYVADGYLLKMAYRKEGATEESDFLSIWQGGWESLGPAEFAGYSKLIDRIKVFYTGDTGTITISYKNEEGDIDTSFDIDMTITPPFEEPDTGHQYYGVGAEKIYVYYPPLDTTGAWWMFDVQETGVDSWDVQRIEVRSELEELID